MPPAWSMDGKEGNRRMGKKKLDCQDPLVWAKADRLLSRFAGGYGKAIYMSIEGDLKTINLVYGNNFETHELPEVPGSYTELLAAAERLYAPRKMEEAEQALNA